MVTSLFLFDSDCYKRQILHPMISRRFRLLFCFITCLIISRYFSIGHHTDAVLQCSPRQLQQVFPTRNVKELGGYKA